MLYIWCDLLTFIALYDTFISTSTDKESNPYLGGLIINKSDHYSACPECVLHVLDTLKAISPKGYWHVSFFADAARQPIYTTG